MSVGNSFHNFTTLVTIFLNNCVNLSSLLQRWSGMSRPQINLVDWELSMPLKNANSFLILN